MLVAVQAEIRVVGSDVLGPLFTQGLSDVGARAHLDLRVMLDGSLPAQGQLLADNADLALLIAGPDAAPWPEAFETIPWAYFGVGVVVPAGNPVPALSVLQLAAIFGALESTSIQRWGDLRPGDLLWQNRSISFHAPSPSGGLAHDLFRYVALRNRPFRKNLTYHATSDEVLRAVSSTPNAIGFVPLPTVQVVGARIVPMVTSAQGAAYHPEAAALHRGDYPLRLPLRWVFRRSSAARLQPLLQRLLAEEGAALATAAGLVPLPPEARREIAADLASRVRDQNSASEK